MCAAAAYIDGAAKRQMVEWQSRSWWDRWTEEWEASRILCEWGLGEGVARARCPGPVLAGGYSIGPYILWVYHTFYGWCVWRLINTPGCLLRGQEQGNGDRGTFPWPGEASQAPHSPVRTSHSHPYVWLEYGVKVEHIARMLVKPAISM